MLSEMGVRSMIRNGSEGFSGEDLGLLLREQRRQESIDRDRERELSIYRSGSCPPTVEGSLNTIEGINNGNGFLTEEELRSDPAYLSYYYSNVNLNPRLPPPVKSKEDWRFAQRLQAVGSSKVGGIGDRRKVNNNSNGEADIGEGSRSLFSMQPGFNSKIEESEVESRKAEWLDKERDGLIGLSLGQQKSFADIFQVICNGIDHFFVSSVFVMVSKFHLLYFKLVDLCWVLLVRIGYACVFCFFPLVCEPYLLEVSCIILCAKTPFMVDVLLRGV